MAKSVDERVVSLKLEDGNFQKGVARVNKSLGTLKGNLEFKDADKGFSNLEKSSKKVKFDQMNRNVEKADRSISDMTKRGSKNFDNLASSTSKSAKQMQKSLDDVKIDKMKESTDKLGDSVNKLGTNTQKSAQTTSNSLKELNNSAAQTGKLLSNINVDTQKPTTAIGAIKAKISELGAHISSIMANSKIKIPTSGVSQSVAAMQKSVDSFTTEHMNSSINSLAGRFEQFGIVAVAAIATLTSKAIDYGGKFISGYVQPMKDGLSEYELQLNSVQTIMANTEQMPEWMGKSSEERLKAVNSTLNDLNKYADETIYNFSQMTHNIGTFTAAGVGLKDSASAIKGISNLAAVSGSNAQQASTAMYQLSQALATGTVKLQDWTSVVNAGMGGQNFQNQLIQTARVFGENVDEAIAKEGSFRDSLADGWLTDKVLIETLKQYAGELSEADLRTAGYNEDQIKQITQLGKTATNAATEVKTLTQLMDTYKEEVGSGWTNFWEYIFGDFDQARKGWTSVHQRLTSIVNDSSNARNAIAKSWSEHGGTEDLYKTINNVLDAFIKLKSVVTNAWRKVFPPRDLGGTIYKVTHFIEQLTEKFILSDKAVQILSSGLEFIFKIFRGILEIIKNVITAIGNFASYIMKVVKTFAAWVLGLTSVREAIKWVQDEFNKAKTIIDKFNESFKNFIESFKKSKSDVGNSSASDNPVSKVVQQFQSAYDGIKSAFAPVGKLIKTFGSQTLDGLYKNSLKTKDALHAIAESFTNLGDKIKEGGEQVSQTLEERLKPVQEFAENISSYIQKLGDVITKVTSWIKEKLKILAHYIVMFFSDLNGHITADEILSLINSGFILSLIKNLNKLVQFWLKSSKDLKKSENPVETVTKSIDKLFKKLGDTFEHLSDTIDFSKIVIFAASMKVLADALMELSNIPADSIATSLGALTVVISELTGALLILANFGAKKQTKKHAMNAGENLFDFSAVNTQLAIGMFALSGSVLLLAKAASYFKGMKPEEVGLAVGAITSLMTVITAALLTLGRFTKDSKAFINIGSALPKFAPVIIAVSISLLAIAGAMKLMDGLDAEGMGRSVVTMVVALGAIGGLLFAMSKISDMFTFMSETETLRGNVVNKTVSTIKGFGFAVMEIAAAIGILAVAMRIIGSMDWASWGRAMVGMSAGFGLMIGAFATISIISQKNMMGANQFTSAVRDMIVMASAMMLLAVSMRVIGSMDWESWSKGLMGIVSCMTILTTVTTVLSRMDSSKSIGTIMAFAGAITLLVVPLMLLASLPTDRLVTSVMAVMASMEMMAITIKHLDGVDATKAGLGIMAMAAGIAIIVPPLLLLAAVPFDALMKSLGAMGTVLIAFIATVMLLGPSQAVLKDVSIGLLLFGASLNVIGLGLIAISAGVVAAAASVDALIVLFQGGLTALFATIPVVFKALMNAFLGMLQVFTAALPQILDALGKILAEIVVFLIKNVPMIVGGVVEMIDETLKQIAARADSIAKNAVIILVAILNALAGEADQLVGAAGKVAQALIRAIAKAFANSNVNAVSDMILTMTAMALLFKLMSKMKKDVVGALIVAGSILLVMTGLVGVFALMSKIDTKTVLPSAISMAAVAGALSVAMMVFSKIPIASVLPAMGSFATAMGLMTAIITAAAAIMSIPGLSDFLNRGVKLFSIIGKAFGSLVGGFAGGIAENALPAISAGLSKFMINLKPFLDGAKQIDESTSKAIEILAKAIGTLTASSFLNSITSFFTGGQDLVAFADSLSGVGMGLKRYADSVKDLNNDAIVKSVDSLNVLIKSLGNMPKTGGIAGWLQGNVKWSTLSNNLGGLGTSMVNYSKAIGGAEFNAEAISNSIPSINALIKVLGTVPRIGGFMGDFKGNIKWSTLSTGLEGLGNALVSYNKAIGNNGDKGAINVGRIKDSVGAVKGLTDVMNVLPDDPNNWFQAITGNSKKWSTLSNGLEGLGKALSAYSKSLGKKDEVDVDNVTKSVTAARALADNISGMKWNDGTKLAGFQTAAKNLGKGLMNFYQEVPPNNCIENINLGIKAADKLINTIIDLPKLPDPLPDYTGLKKVSKQLGDGVYEFGSNKGFNLIDWSMVSNAVSAMDTLVNAIKALPALSDQDFSIFPTLCQNLGGGLSTYHQYVSNIADYDLITSSIEPLKSLLRRGREDDVSTKFEVFPIAAGNLGSGLQSFQQSLVISDLAVISKGIKPVDDMLKMIRDNVDDPNKTFVSFPTAATNFGAGLKAFADAMKEYNKAGLNNLASAAQSFKLITDSIKDLPSDYTNVSSLKEAIEMLASIDLQKFSNTLADVGTTISQNMLTLTNDLGDKCTVISGKINTLKETIATDSAEMATPFVDQISSMQGAAGNGFNGISNSLDGLEGTVSSFASTVNEQIGAIASNITNKLNDCIKAVTDANPKISEQSKAFGKAVKDGIINGSRGMGSALNVGLRHIKESLDGASSDAYQSGVYLTRGFADGISNPIAVGEVASAAASVAQTALDKIKEVGAEGSPWKTTIQSGRYAAQGLAIGIRKDSDQSRIESVKMVSNLLSSISDTIDNYDLNTDMTPTVTPVMNLSDMKRSTALFSNLMDSTANVGLDYHTTKDLARKVGQVRSNGDELRQYQSDMIDSNKTVTDAINALRDDVNNIDLTKQPPTELYIDGRKLASTIAKPMDRQMSIQRRRGSL